MRVYLFLLPRDGSEEGLGARLGSNSRPIHSRPTVSFRKVFRIIEELIKLISMSFDSLKEPYTVEQLTSALKLLVWAIVNEGGLADPAE